MGSTGFARKDSAMDILIIEDSNFLRAAIERTLTKAGYDVSSAPDGPQGVKVALAQMPEVILLDMMLPGLDGTCVLRELKQNRRTATIPVIVMTSLSQCNEARLKQDGAAEFIEKSQLGLNEANGPLLRMVEETLDGRCSDPDSRCTAQAVKQVAGKHGNAEQQKGVR